MDDLLLKVISRLANIHEDFGPRVYRNAGHQALVGIARAVQAEAELQAGGNDTGKGGLVIRFPLDRARQRDSDDA